MNWMKDSVARYTAALLLTVCSILVFLVSTNVVSPFPGGETNIRGSAQSSPTKAMKQSASLKETQPRPKEQFRPKNKQEQPNRRPRSRNERPPRSNRSPVPNQVEREPQKIEEMTIPEIETVISRYKEWMHKGEISLELSLAATAEQLKTLAEFYHVEGPENLYELRPEGRFKVIRSSEARLGSPLPHDKWPTEAGDLLGSLEFLRANPSSFRLIYSRKAELRIYRVLAEVANERRVGRGQTVVLEPRLHRLSGEVEIFFAEIKQADRNNAFEATNKQQGEAR